MADSSRIEELRRRVHLDPASIAFAALAEEYRRAGRFEDAIATCEAGLQRHPAYLSARVTLGRSLLGLGRVEEARHQLEHVLRVAPENLAAIRGLAEIHDRGTDYTEVAGQDAEIASAGGSEAAGAAPPVPVHTAAGPVAMSTPAAAPVPVPAPASIPIAAAPSPAPVAASIPVVVSAPAPVVHPPHPDAVALPALEAFLAALVASTASSRTPPV